MRNIILFSSNCDFLQKTLNDGSCNLNVLFVEMVEISIGAVNRYCINRKCFEMQILHSDAHIHCFHTENGYNKSVP